MRRGTVVSMMSLLLLGWIQVPLRAQHLSSRQTSNGDSQPSVWEEAVYVVAMETVFAGMSFLGSRQDRLGPATTGGVDLFLAVAGLQNASVKESGVQQNGHYLVSAGFAAKSLYNFYLGRDHSSSTQFWTNFISYNVLVFVGYYLDTL